MILEFVQIKKCDKCNIEKPIEDFEKKRGTKYYTLAEEWKEASLHYRKACKECSKIIQRKRYNKYKNNNYFAFKCSRIKRSAKSKSLDFDLTPEFLSSIWTDKCPVFDYELDPATDSVDPASPELDRIIPEKGYVKGNVVFLSRRANNLKSNASLEEMERLVKWLYKTK